MDEWESVKSQLELVYEKVLEFSVGKYRFLYRPLNVKDLQYGTDSGLPPDEVEDYYVKTATLYPQNFDFDKLKAGYILQYADKILEESGFHDLKMVNDLLEKHRSAGKNSIIRMMISYIITAMPAYKADDLLDLSMDELSKLTVMSEEIITLQQIISGVETTGFRLVIKPVGDTEEEEYEEEFVPQPVKKVAKKRPAPTASQPLTEEDIAKKREMLVQEIMAQNDAMTSPANRVPVDASSLKEMDIESLERIKGITRRDDPIAAKLAAAKDKVARTARSMGIPYEY